MIRELQETGYIRYRDLNVTVLRVTPDGRVKVKISALGDVEVAKREKTAQNTDSTTK